MSAGESLVNDLAAEAASVLRHGGLVVMPTDTVYGIAASPDVPGAKDRIYEAKGRDRGKPIAMLVSDAGEARKRGAVFAVRAARLAERFWPGALTLVLPVGDGFEGFRVPDHPLALAVIRAAGGALYVTSANATGEPPVTSASEGMEKLKPFVDFALDGVPLPGGRESSVVKITGTGLDILREGAISRKEIES